ncbi:hypothetical protein KVR01_002788 [Diaporthe batatas]|uniref:uncharacterized protein n=1 Tax=Diaporthe batatas TaxID=748121 RepID=UPI001D055600|nr:uncharacterized protein KVR01_002788 [Diaporthe batatas]KAG8167099.1 hypothetical protein KVR01_002788 [Diaporthe batatas]
MDPTDQPHGDASREAAAGLCSICRGLNLHRDKFILESRQPASRHYTAQALHGDSLRTLRAETQLTSGNGECIFSSLDIISQQRGDCVLCNVIWRAVNRYSGNKAPTTGPLGLLWELDGRCVGGDYRLVNRTRRIRISWRDTDGRTESVCLVLVGSQNDPQDDHAFLGREAVPFQQKLDIMRGWLETCTEKHDQSCSDELGTRAEFERLVVATYFGVIDVVDIQLKPLPTAQDGRPEKYVALSYVWGDTAGPHVRYMTTRRNVMKRIQERGLGEDWRFLPKTIQDAVLLVRALGQRYLWVDSLCIVQDSTSSWELNAKAMHLVYGNAFFTICAADGDARTGLRAIQDVDPLASQTAETRKTSATSPHIPHPYDTPKFDVYGRPIRPGAQAGTDFTSILPENPFGVNRGPFSIDSDLLGAEAMPVLQFWTFRHKLYISIQDSHGGSAPEAGDLCQCDIRDRSGDWCGVIKLPRSYAETCLDRSLFFVALSEAKSFTMGECPVWNYYIPKEREDSEWDLYFVLLLERNKERALWERVALGKVFKAAFSGSVWDEIKLG